ncbi:MAG: glycosyltransferase [Spirochaetota bacterium]
MTPQAARRIVHISTVHSAIDPRIRLKQLRSLVKLGLEAHLVTADPASGRYESDGVIVHQIGRDRSNRLRRMLVLAPRAIWKALLTPAAAYHIHDPELTLWAWVLRARMVPIVYDVHEDFALFMRHKPYIPATVGRMMGAGVGLVEKILTAGFRVVIAEHCYRTRFARSTVILNYPHRTMLDSPPSRRGAPKNLIYTGNVTVARGAINMARVVREDPDVAVDCVGQCASSVANRIREAAGDAFGRFHIVGQDRYVPFEEITAHYARKDLLAGIVLIPDSPHYRDKHLTKFYEYMAAGLPIIASDFPTWRRLIADQGLGICVDAEDPAAVARAVDRLARSPDTVCSMGERGRRLVESRYSWERQEQTLLSVYLRI